LDIDDMQLDLVHKKMEAVDEQIAALKAKKTAAKTPAPAPPAPHGKPHG